MKGTGLAVLLMLPFAGFAHGEHACENNRSGNFGCSHAEYLAHLTVLELGSNISDDGLNDLWGWTDPASGREFVIIGMYHGTAFVEITDPTHPVFLGRLPSPGTGSAQDSPGEAGVLCHENCASASLWMDVKVFDHYAYIVSEQKDFGLRVFDLYRLLHVETPQVFSADSIITSFGNAHNLFINEDTGFAYVVGNNDPRIGEPENFGGLLIFDLSDPLNPKEVVDYENIQYVHDVQCVVYAGPDVTYKDHEICFASNSGRRRNTDPASVYYGQVFYFDDNTKTFRSDWTFNETTEVLVWPDGSTTSLPAQAEKYAELAVLDVTDKSDIKLLGTAAHEGAVYVHQSWLDEGHEFLMVNDELKSAHDGSRTVSYVFDVRDLDAIRVHADYLHPTMAVAHNEYVKGRFTYQANYGAGLRVLDISAPANPVQVAYFDTQPDTDDVGFYGTWTAFPFFESGTIAMSDMEDGLVLARLALTDAGALAPDIAVAAKLLLVEGAEDVLYVAYANDGPAPATKVDFSFHLPPGFAFSSIEPPQGMTCTAPSRVINCQVEEIPSCSAAMVALPLDASAIESEQEIVGMAAAKEIEIAGNTADNVARVKVADGTSVADLAALASGLLSNACNTPPVIDAGENQSVLSRDAVTLHLVTDEPAASLTEITWQQIGGPAVVLSAPHETQTGFTAPDVSATESLLFSVSVTNIYGLTSEDTVTVTVNPKPGTGGNGGGALLYLLLLPLLGLQRHRRWSR